MRAFDFVPSGIPNHHEVIGYQADMSRGGVQSYWGCLYDESRRRKMLVTPDAAKIKKALKPDNFNRYVIRCEGPRIRIWLNDSLMVDYIEPDKRIARRGVIGLQIHAGPPSEAYYKEISIVELGK